MNLSRILGTALPLIQAPMAGVQDHALAVAVCNAGGLGSLPAAMLGPEALRKELAAIRDGTSRPYNVNFFCHTPPKPDAEREARWREALAPYYAEFGIDSGAITAGSGRTPFDHDAADVLEEFRPPIVSFHFGLPADDLLARVRGWGSKVLATATSLEEATWLEARGVDAIIAQGAEAGGHRGYFLSPSLDDAVSTLALVQQFTQAVGVPIVAAGGIGSAEAAADALAAGATGVQIGTAYLLCSEATTSAVHRAALQSDAARETAFTNLFSGRPARGIVNRLMREIGPLSALPPEFPLASAAVAPLRAAAERRNSGDFSPLWAGTDTRGCAAVPAAQLTRTLASKLR